MTTYYKSDITKVTNAELKRIAPNRVAYLVARLHKLLRWPFPAVMAFRRSDRLDTLEFDELPRPARRAMRETLDECEDRGFRLAFCHAVESIGPAEAYGVVLLSPDGLVWASAVYSRVRTRAGTSVKSGCA